MRKVAHRNLAIWQFVHKPGDEEGTALLGLIGNAGFHFEHQNTVILCVGDKENTFIQFNQNAMCQASEGEALTLTAKIFSVLFAFMKGSVKKCLVDDMNDLKAHLEGASGTAGE